MLLAKIVYQRMCACACTCLHSLKYSFFTTPIVQCKETVMYPIITLFVFLFACTVTILHLFRKNNQKHTHKKTQNKTSNQNYICSEKNTKQPKLYLLRALLVSWYFEPSQPHRNTTGLDAKRQLLQYTCTYTEGIKKFSWMNLHKFHYHQDFNKYIINTMADMLSRRTQRYQFLQCMYTNLSYNLHKNFYPWKIASCTV